MNRKNFTYPLIAIAALSFGTMLPYTAEATIVEIETSVGIIQVNLYDLGTPDTVANFLAYVNSGAYDDSIIHRSAPGFIVQGGGFVSDMDGNVTAIPQNAAVNNEPTYSNVAGTIAMAKLGSDANSATNQWFFNLANNAGNLDNQNGGFTAFGEVVDGFMTAVDAIADVPIFDKGGAFTEIPLQNYTNGDLVVFANFVVILNITIIDNTADSAGVAGLTPPLSTASNGGGGGGNGGGGGGGGGGNLGLLALFGLAALSRRRYRLAKAA
jgi:peptidyl-prolyl cis-trans isomerase A (cyclophilin A)